jgi:hypothetical protein
MDPKDNPQNAGPAMAQQIPGVGILMALRQMGEKIGPGMMQQVMQMLTGGGQPQGPMQGGPQYRPDQQLPRHGGIGPDGQPIIIPGGQ